MELWKDIKGYEGRYQVSNMGNVRSLKTNIILSPINRQHGYKGVMLYGNGGHKRGFKTFSVHRLVAEAFVPNPLGKEEVNHINEDKTDNRAVNLEWMTHKENASHATRGERIGKANTNNPKRSVPVAQYTLDGEFVAEYPSIQEAHRKTGINTGSIWSVCEGKTRKSGGYKWTYSK